MTNRKWTEDQIVSMLRTVTDPEIPVLDIVEMGIVRGVRIDHTGITVVITPTYSGCPAMDAIRKSICSCLEGETGTVPHIETVLSPAWTTTWMTNEAREKLRQYGIAPPMESGLRTGLGAANRSLVSLPHRRSSPAEPQQDGLSPIACPYCGSNDTRIVSEFGSTACKSLYSCNSCIQPFEYFKPL